LVIDSRIGWLASLSYERPGVCEDGHAYPFYVEAIRRGTGRNFPAKSPTLP